MPMPSLELSPLEIWQLRDLARTAAGRTARRALMVLWRAEGLTTAAIGQRLDCHRDTVSHWLERYCSFGVDGLQDEPRSGRPPHLDPAARAHLDAVLAQAPPEEDAPRASWTLAHLRTVFQEVATRPFGVETLRRTVHALGFRWRRPRLWAHKEDPETYEKQLLVELARQQTAETTAVAALVRPDAPPPVHFLFADASDQHLLAVIRAMWMRRGQQVRVQTPPRNGHWSIFGGLNLHTGAFHWQPYEKSVTASFLLFLQHLLTAYPKGEILLVVDNASYHTSKAAVGWLREHPRLLPLYLPARRPDLNPVEQIWKALKAAVSANRSFDNLEVLARFIRAHFDALSPAQFLTQAGVRQDFSEAT